MINSKAFSAVFILLVSVAALGLKCSNAHSVNQPQTFKAVSDPRIDTYVLNQDSSLNTLIAQGKRHIVINRPILMTEDLSIPYGYTIDINGAGQIVSEGPVVLRLYGDFQAGNSKIFGQNLKVIFGAGSVEKVNVNWFGAFADTQLIIGEEGLDDTEQIQRAIEAAQIVRNVYLPSYWPEHFKRYGVYRISKPLQVRITGDKYHGISLYGEESYDRPKTSIYADFNSGGALNIQSARGTVIAYLAITGKNRAPEENKGLYSSRMEDYISDNIDVSKKTAYSGITIDAIAGEPGSANTIIKYCRISRFYVGINVNAAGETQGDMLSVEHNALEYNAVHLAVGNSQARSMSITRCDIGRGHTVLDNITFGAQLGSTVNFNQNQITSCYQLFNYTTAAGGPSEISGNYGENLGRLGKVLGGRNQNTLTIRDGTFKFVPIAYEVDKFFEGQTKMLISSCLIQVNGGERLLFTNSKSTRFENTRFRGKKGMPVISGDRLEFEYCTIANSHREKSIQVPSEMPKE